MRILHYSLGFPPYRSGGLTKFALDLMREQVMEGDTAALLWPGEMRIFNKTVSIKKRSNFEAIESYELINPLPISYDEGIQNIPAFTATVDGKVYKEFLLKYQPDVIHLHTFMGLHKEFLEAAKELNIRAVFSVHDFFTICPKVTMFRKGQVCWCVDSCIECPECNMTALSEKKIFVLQTPLYRTLKNSSVVKKLRKGHRDRYLSGYAEVAVTGESRNTANDYRKLRNYYKEMINLISVVHYNSTVTKEVFERVFYPANSYIIPITHGDIKENKRLKTFTEPLRLSYLGPQGGAKGFFLLKAALDELWTEGVKFSLNVYFTPTEVSPYMNIHDRYLYSELETVMDETDLLICPSIWYETFGYTVIEALSFGVPVLVSENVGAKDIIPAGCGGVFKDKKDLENIIREMRPKKLQEWNKNIMNENILMDMKWMATNIKNVCYGVEQ